MNPTNLQPPSYDLQATARGPSRAAALPQQLTCDDVAWVFQCDVRTVRRGCKRTPPELPFYEKFGRIYFSPEDVAREIASRKRRALARGDTPEAENLFLAAVERLVARWQAGREAFEASSGPRPVPGRSAPDTAKEAA